MLGIGIVILSELLDRRVRLSRDLEHGLDAPLLVVLNAGHPNTIPLLGAPAAGGRALPSPG